MQLDQGEKGFSFMREGPLDMRMDPESPLTAREIVNKWPEEKLGKLFWELGDEPRSRSIAKAIVSARREKPIETTRELADIISGVAGRVRKRLHPATLCFQAIRMAVNQELEAIQQALPKAMHYLASGGMLAVMSFHSLEDRIVKALFKEAAHIPAQNKYRAEEYTPTLKLVTKRPLEAGEKECKFNPRARSAKLRIVEKT
ncbi:MAG: Ribosomal RNA small subunit methyltransferase H [Chlamydiae bacterium]|nr:Ribosomal RNA small subunit methyltransferase H [Chlamydiota bacterium]